MHLFEILGYLIHYIIVYTVECFHVLVSVLVLVNAFNSRIGAALYYILLRFINILC